MTDAIRTLLAKQEIYEVLVRYCRGIDRTDEELVRSCYHADAFDDHGMFQGPAAEFAAYAVENLRTMERTMHCIHNVSIVIEDSAAASEAYCVAYHRMRSRDGGQSDHLVGVRYVDRFECRDGGPWLIAHRTVVYEWSRIDPVGREWRMRPEYTVGTRDHHDRSYQVVRELGAEDRSAADDKPTTGVRS
jgi:SnoaL-like protein